ncbi:MAG: hypothetical protein PVJ34_05055 [Anaerolineae bacterium]
MAKTILVPTRCVPHRAQKLAEGASTWLRIPARGWALSELAPGHPQGMRS